MMGKSTMMQQVTALERNASVIAVSHVMGLNALQDI
jgi:hypothetical protein